MAEGGSGDAKPYTIAKSSHSWSYIPNEYDESSKRRELREYIIPISVLHLDSADRKVIKIAGTKLHINSWLCW